MNVKINIKKLFGMTIRIKNLEQENGSFRKELKALKSSGFKQAADMEKNWCQQEETINYLTDENDALKRKNKYMNQVIGKLIDKIPKEKLSPAEQRWCDLEEQLWKDREEFMKDEDPMDG